MWEFPLKMWNVYCIPKARYFAGTRLLTPTISKLHVACMDFLVLNSHGNTNICGIFVAFLGNHWAQPCKIILPTVSSTECGGRCCLCVPGCWSHMPRLVSHSPWVSGFPGRQIPILELIMDWRAPWGNNKEKVIEHYQNWRFPMRIMPGSAWLEIGEAVLCQDSWNKASKIWTAFSLLVVKQADKVWVEEIGGKMWEINSCCLAMCAWHHCTTISCLGITWEMRSGRASLLPLLLPGEYQHMLVFLRASWLALAVPHGGTQQCGAAQCMERHASEAQEGRTDCTGELPSHLVPSACCLSWVGGIFSFPLSVNMAGKIPVLRERRSPLILWCM